MGLWSAYFFAKLLLYARGDMAFNPWLNLGFAAFTALAPGNSRQRFAKNLIALPVGAMLLYQDSSLPPLATISPLYLAALIYHSFSWKWIVAVAALIAGYSLAWRKLRLSTFIFIAILWVAIGPAPRVASATAHTIAGKQPAGNALTATDLAPDADPRSWQPSALDARLDGFYQEQSKRQVRFARPADDGVPYDILILQVSSLSWDDLEAIDRTQDALLSRFDIVFSQFNSAASEAAAAQIRLLRSGCGQIPEKQLYDPPPGECLTLDALQRAGFAAHWLTNDPAGPVARGSIRQQGPLFEAPETLPGARATQQAADGSAVFDDYSMLSQWTARRAADPAQRVLLYYNSVSLDDGNRPLGRSHGAIPYAPQLARFAADLDHFIDDLQRSGRHAILVVMAEHGAALNGDRQQPPGIREIPMPSITRVPVGVMLVNAVRPPHWTQERIDAPSSYLGISELLARFIADNPFDRVDTDLKSYLTALPQTDFVAENSGITVLEIGKRKLMRSPDGAWSTLEY